MVEDLCHQAKELREEFSTMCSIRDGKKKSHWIFSETLNLQEFEPPAVLKEKKIVCAY